MAKKILVVDDEEVICNLVEFRLKLDGFSVSKALSGDEALKMIDGGFRPDVILLDIAMPGISGLDLCKIVKSRPNLKETKVVLITALTDEHSQKTGLDAGADWVIFKPFKGNDVIKKIEELVGKNLKGPEN